MKRFVSRALDAIRDQIESWGLRLPRATREHGPRVYVLGPGAGDQAQLIGTLSQEDGEFVFRYDAAFAKSHDAHAISAFPDLTREYKSPDLWPFFAVRIPPADRSDVKDALARKGLRSDQTLEVLGTLAKRSISNAYRLELVAAP